MQTPPHNLEAEQAVLGSALMSAEAADGVVGELTAADFWRSSHGKVFSAIAALVHRGAKVDPTTVADELKADLDEKVQLLEYQSGAISSHWREYAAIVKRDALSRRLIDAGTAITALGYSGGDISEAESLVERIETGTTVHRSIGEVIDQVAQSCVTASEYITLPVIDVRLRPGEVCVIAARPKIGKTSLIAQMARELSERHLKTVIYNFEMSNEEVASRYISQVAGVSRERMDDGIGKDGAAFISKNTAGDWRRFLYTVDHPMSMAALCADIRRSARRGARVAFIDYLQLVVDGSSYEEVTRFSRQLKLAAKSAGIPVVAVSQLSRMEPGQEPASNKLRQSGAIEQDADVVVLMHSYEYPERDDLDLDSREKYRNKGYLFEMSDPRKFGYLRVALHRSGPTYTIPAMYDGAEYRWDPLNQLEEGSV